MQSFVERGGTYGKDDEARDLGLVVSALNQPGCPLPQPRDPLGRTPRLPLPRRPLGPRVVVRPPALTPAEVGPVHVVRGLLPAGPTGRGRSSRGAAAGGESVAIGRVVLLDCGVVPAGLKQHPRIEKVNTDSVEGGWLCSRGATHLIPARARRQPVDQAWEQESRSASSHAVSVFVSPMADGRDGHEVLAPARLLSQALVCRLKVMEPLLRSRQSMREGGKGVSLSGFADVQRKCQRQERRSTHLRRHRMARAVGLLRIRMVRLDELVVGRFDLAAARADGEMENLPGGRVRVPGEGEVGRKLGARIGAVAARMGGGRGVGRCRRSTGGGREWLRCRDGPIRDGSTAVEAGAAARGRPRAEGGAATAAAAAAADNAAAVSLMDRPTGSCTSAGRSEGGAAAAAASISVRRRPRRYRRRGRGPGRDRAPAVPDRPSGADGRRARRCPGGEGRRR